jgi:CRP/FNR family transcriptional regulator, cyclic AMP receptor protein
LHFYWFNDFNLPRAVLTDDSIRGAERGGNLSLRLILSARNDTIKIYRSQWLGARQVYVMATKRRRSFDTKSFLARVGEGQSIGKYRKGQIVFSQGDAGDAVFYIQKGKAKVTVVSEQGKEAVIAILGTDEFFGEGCLAGQVQRIATVTAMADSVIARLEKSAIIQVIHQEPKFSEMFIAHLLGRAIRVEADLVDQLFNSSEKRLARLLLLLANFGKEGTPEPMIAKISQETLAEMIGTTRSRVSFFMNKFRKLGFIDYNGGIEVHSSLLNVVLHDQPPIKN